jgi:hypothetical protein
MKIHKIEKSCKTVTNVDIKCCVSVTKKRKKKN